MHLSYSLNRHDLARGQWLRTSFWKFLLPMSLFPSAWTLVSLTGSGVPITLDPIFLTEFVPPLLMGVMLTLALRFILIPWHASLLHRQNPLLFCDLELTVDTAGVHIKGPRSDTRWEWSDLQGFKEGADIFLICLSRSMNYIVPKRALSAEETTHFRDLLLQHLRKM